MTDIRWLCTVTILLTVIVAVAVWLSGSGRWLLEQIRPVEEAELTPVSDGYQGVEEYLAERGREFPALYETPPPAPVECRAKFDCPWSVVGVADVDPELVDRAQLTAWLATGGRRVGLGDWRPEKSGHYGRFNVEKVLELADAA